MAKIKCWTRKKKDGSKYTTCKKKKVVKKPKKKVKKPKRKKKTKKRTKRDALGYRSGFYGMDRLKQYGVRSKSDWQSLTGLW